MEITITIPSLNKFRNAVASFPQIAFPMIDRAIRQSIFEVQREAQMRTPVATGRLRSSYATRFGNLEGAVGPTVEYAIFVHEGTRFMGGRPFLEQGMETAKESILGHFRKALENTMDEIAKRSK